MSCAGLLASCCSCLSCCSQHGLAAADFVDVSLFRVSKLPVLVVLLVLVGRVLEALGALLLCCRLGDDLKLLVAGVHAGGGLTALGLRAGPASPA